jgi:hypothetical protein
LQADPPRFRARCGGVALGAGAGPAGPVGFVEFHPFWATSLRFTSGGAFSGRVTIPARPIGICHLALCRSSATVRVIRLMGPFVADVSMDVGANRMFIGRFQRGTAVIGCSVNAAADPRKSSSTIDFASVLSPAVSGACTLNILPTGLVTTWSYRLRLGRVALLASLLFGISEHDPIGGAVSAKVAIPRAARTTFVAFFQAKPDDELIRTGIGIAAKSRTGEKVFAGLQFRKDPVVQLTVRKRFGESAVIASLLVGPQLNPRFRLDTSLHVAGLPFEPE